MLLSNVQPSLVRVNTRTGIDEYGDKGVIAQRFYKNPDCKNAYKNFMCWSNFPRCDDNGQSLILCESVCENYQKSCGVRTRTLRCDGSSARLLCCTVAS